MEEFEILDNYLENEVEIDTENILKKIELKLEEIPYLKQMIRKTEIYLRRHEDLDESRKKEILYNSLKREIRYLKKGVLMS